MPFPSEVKLNEELLKDSERHVCQTLEDHWAMITVKDSEAILWDNSTGNPEGPPAKLEVIMIGIAYCPFCGERFGEPNEATEAIIEVIEGALACVDNIGYKSYSDADFAAAMRVKDQLQSGRIQITAIEPS